MKDPMQSEPDVTEAEREAGLGYLRAKIRSYSKALALFDGNEDSPGRKVIQAELERLLKLQQERN
jgi:hypothetical protein